MAGCDEPLVRPATRHARQGFGSAYRLIAALFLTLFAVRAAAADSDAVERGKYIFDAGGCYGCHTDVKGKGPTQAYAVAT